ncbi:MAG: glycosyltransferase [Alphaproteobacteria bacterium]|nr:glycosyltransferase [Alphaproteobacteria bacterium]
MSKVAVLIPCYNEELTIAKVVKDCKKYLPKAEIFVCDNNSTDKTAEKAKKAGAKVMFEGRQGKGNAVRRMFADIDADVYVMIDGDGTYDIKAIPNLIKILQDEKSDMVVGVRKETEDACYRSGHRGGNKVLTKIVELILGYKLRDMLSGLRVFSKRFVKTFPAESKGFEIETELTIFALSRRLPIKEVDTDYFSRPEGSFSKLSTYKDGIIILKTIVFLIKEECPMMFFGMISLFLFLIGLGLGIPVVIEYLNTGLVPRFPTAILASSLMICSFISFLMGVVLDSVAKVKKEISRANYLKY